MARIRVRQHVNPLSQKYQQPIHPPDWTKIYSDPTKPLHLDIGSARGRFLLEMAQLQPAINFLGMEIREPLVVEANLLRTQLGLSNLHYLFSNVNNSFSLLGPSLPLYVLNYITIQFPDPWFKKRHIKRRVVQQELVNSLATYLVEGGTIFIQSDVESVAQQICDRFNSHPSFQKKHPQTWLPTNPLPVSTEREKATLALGKPVYRALFTKISTT